MTAAIGWKMRILDKSLSPSFQDVENPDTETYCCTPDKHGRGTFFFTDCGNQMYSVSNDWKEYHGKLCPKCDRVLYLRGTDEANKIVTSK